MTDLSPTPDEVATARSLGLSLREEFEAVYGPIPPAQRDANERALAEFQARLSAGWYDFGDDPEEDEQWAH